MGGLQVLHVLVYSYLFIDLFGYVTLLQVWRGQQEILVPLDRTSRTASCATVFQ